MQKEIASHKNATKGGPFKLNMHPRAYFDANPYNSDKLPKRSSSAGLPSKKDDSKPFKPSSPGKKVRIKKWQSYINVQVYACPNLCFFNHKILPYDIYKSTWDFENTTRIELEFVAIYEHEKSWKIEISIFWLHIVASCWLH